MPKIHQQDNHAAQAQSGEDQVMRHGRSTMIADIRRALPTKHNQLFLLTAESGDIIPGAFGHGLYFRDTCFLDQCQVRLQGYAPIVLLANADRGHESVFELTNPDIPLDDGQVLHKERLGMRRRYTIADDVTMSLALHSHSQEDIHLKVTLVIDAHFRNMFTIRGAAEGKRGTLHPPHHTRNALVLAYDGADAHRRTTTLTFDPTPTHITQNTVTYALTLAPGAHHTITVTMAVADQPPTDADHHGQAYTPAASKAAHATLDHLLQDVPHITTNNPQFDQALQRALADLRMLAMATQDKAFLIIHISPPQDKVSLNKQSAEQNFTR